MKAAIPNSPGHSQELAATITKAASKQTYFTIRYLVDRKLVADAYRAYGYFRWVDDFVDAIAGDQAEKLAFVQRQQSLLEACYRGETPDNLQAEECMLVDLIHADKEERSGLQAYLRNMMGVMSFDVRRRGQLITQDELTEYSRMLATGITEAMYYFIGHDDTPPCHEARYLPVTAAHVTHLLRDAYEDIEAGYFNIPLEYLHAHALPPTDVESDAYQEWVRERVQLGRAYFRAGRECLAEVPNLRCRLAGYAYTARFEWMLRTFEHDQYRLRREYPDRKGLHAGLWMVWSTLVSLFAPYR